MDNHPLHSMPELHKLEMQLEWEALVQEMNLTTVLGKQGFEFSRKMFIEAYSRAYAKYANPLAQDYAKLDPG